MSNSQKRHKTRLISIDVTGLINQIEDAKRTVRLAKVQLEPHEDSFAGAIFDLNNAMDQLDDLISELDSPRFN
jgi:hypothetical protein